MRVLHIYKSGPFSSVGGVETFVSCLAKNLNAHSVSTTILSISDVSRISVRKTEHFREIQCPKFIELFSTKFSRFSLIILRRMISKFDLIHLHHPDPFAILIYYLAKGDDTRCVVTYHSDIVSQKYLEKLYRPINRFLFKKVDKIIFSSPQYLEQNQLGRKFHDKSNIIPLGIDPPPENKALLARVSHWERVLPKRYIVFVGQFRTYKGLLNLFSALKGTEYNLVLVGSGKLEHRLKQAKNDNEMENVIFLGQLSDLDKYAVIHLSGGLVLPSKTRAEAFGISLLEAASMSKPLITCKIGSGTSFVNQHRETGLEVPPNDPDKLRTAISEILGNKTQAEIYGLNARQRYKKLFTSKLMVDEYLKLYLSITNHKSVGN